MSRRRDIQRQRGARSGFDPDSLTFQLSPVLDLTPGLPFDPDLVDAPICWHGLPIGRCAICSGAAVMVDSGPAATGESGAAVVVEAYAFDALLPLCEHDLPFGRCPICAGV